MARSRGRPTVLLLLLLPVISAEFLTVYMDNKKGTKYSAVSVRVETSLARTYSANVNAWVLLTTPDSFPIWYVRIQRFDVEALLAGGSCHDYFNLYNGNSLSSPRLNVAPLCGQYTTTRTYFTTGRDLSLQFVTDATAELTGVDVIATAAFRGQCTSSSEQFQCKNESVCISSSLRCDGFAHCVDGSDEDGMLCQGPTDSTNSVLVATIVGCLIGGIILIALVIALIIYCVRERERRRIVEQLRRQRMGKMTQVGPMGLNEYPVTNTYRKKECKQFFVDEDITDQDWGLYYGSLYSHDRQADMRKSKVDSNQEKKEKKEEEEEKQEEKKEESADVEQEQSRDAAIPRAV